jgi:hypothetical protein
MTRASCHRFRYSEGRVWLSIIAYPVLPADAGREPPHTPAVQENGAAERRLGGGDGADGGDEHTEIRATWALRQETCL